MFTLLLALAPAAGDAPFVVVSTDAERPAGKLVRLAPDLTATLATQIGEVTAMDIYDLNTNQRLGAVSVDQRAQERGQFRTQLRGVGWADDSHITFEVSQTMDLSRVASRVRRRSDVCSRRWPMRASSCRRSCTFRSCA